MPTIPPRGKEDAVRGRNQINIFGPFTDFFSNSRSLFLRKVITVPKNYIFFFFICFLFITGFLDSMILIFFFVIENVWKFHYLVKLARIMYFCFILLIQHFRSLYQSIAGSLFIYQRKWTCLRCFKQRLISSCNWPDATRTWSLIESNQWSLVVASNRLIHRRYKV